MGLEPRVGAANQGANPTIVFYKGSVVKNYNATYSLARFENKKSSILKNVLAYYDAGIVCM
jgi:hypothetical protein